MQDPRLPLSGEISNGKPRKKKGSSTSRASMIQLKGNDAREIQHGQAVPLRTSQKLSSKNLGTNEYAPSATMYQQTERSNSDSLPDSSGSGNDYRALRRKYLLLEEESFALGSELTEVEDEVNTLEYEKLALLDQLIVLEGLVDPSEVQLQFLEDKYLQLEKPKTEAAMKDVEEGDQCMSLSAALELVKQKGSAMERLEFLETRVLQLSLEMELGKSASNSSSSVVTEAEYGDDDHKHLIVKQEPKKAPNFSVTQKGTRRGRGRDTTRKWAAGWRWLHMGCNS